MKRKGTISRRTFLARTAGTGAAVLAAATAAAQDKKPPRRKTSDSSPLPPSERLNIACVGCGGKGHSDIQGVAMHNIVALCDTDEDRARGTFRAYPDVPKYKDFRVMLEKHAHEIDAVTVSTPDHIHAPAAMMAIKMGKHVYVQKPLTHSVYEARALAEAARKHKVATQMGNQGQSSEGIRVLAEMIWGGAIGKVREVHIWTNRPIWPQGQTRPEGGDPVPATLDWDLWLGPAPQRPYKGKREIEPYKGHGWYCPFTWRGWWDFGTGALGDIGCHTINHPFLALKLGHPAVVSAETSPVNSESAPQWSIVTYEFPARGDMPAVKLVWYDGGKKPPRPRELDESRRFGGNGMLFIGDEGAIFDGRIIPESRMKDFGRPKQVLPRVSGHYSEWIEACKGGTPASSNFDVAGPLTEAVLLGNVAIRCGKRVEWDAPNLKVANVPEANALLRREYRKGWTL